MGLGSHSRRICTCMLLSAGRELVVVMVVKEMIETTSDVIWDGTRQVSGHFSPAKSRKTSQTSGRSSAAVSAAAAALIGFKSNKLCVCVCLYKLVLLAYNLDSYHNYCRLRLNS